MKADCFLVVARKKFSPGHEVSVAIKKEYLTIFFWIESQFYVSFDYLECRRKKTVILLSVCSNVHQDSEIHYLSNDSFRSSTTFIRKDGRFGVSSTNLTAAGSRRFFWWLSETVVPGHEVSEGIDRDPSTIFITMLRSITLRADTRRLLHC